MTNKNGTMAYPGVPPIGMDRVGGGPAQPPPQHQEKFDSAIEFLERVKVVYADHPEVYNQFLDIMKVRQRGTFLRSNLATSNFPPF